MKEATDGEARIKVYLRKGNQEHLRYKEELGDVAHSSYDIAVGVIYIQKEALGEPAP